jgi:hypothetical protein
MKTQYLFPIVAAAIGFSIAWIAKPTPTPTTATTGHGASDPAGPRARPDSKRPRPDSIAGKRPVEVQPGEFPLADLAENGPKTRSEAKMLRLAEALGLSIDQQGEIIRIIEDTKAEAKSGTPVIEDLTIRGRKVEEALSKILDPEQYAKFQEIRVRERDNRVEMAAQRSLAQVLNEIDLSPGQRDEALARLRQAEKENIQAVPSAATLLLRTSVLPTDSKELTMDGLLAISKLENAAPPEDLGVARQQFIHSQKQAIEIKLRSFEGILSPAQMGQFQAILAEQQAALDRGH